MNFEKIGRKHTTREDAFLAIREAQEVGFKNINVDIIYALPGQTIEDVKETLDIAFYAWCTTFLGIFINCGAKNSVL